MIRARFAYYYPPLEDIPAMASYLVVEGMTHKLRKGMNVGADQLFAEGVSLPLTPTYDTWLKLGSPVYRGEDVINQSLTGESGGQING